MSAGLRAQRRAADAVGSTSTGRRGPRRSARTFADRTMTPCAGRRRPSRPSLPRSSENEATLTSPSRESPLGRCRGSTGPCGGDRRAQRARARASKSRAPHSARPDPTIVPPPVPFHRRARHAPASTSSARCRCRPRPRGSRASPSTLARASPRPRTSPIRARLRQPLGEARRPPGSGRAPGRGQVAQRSAPASSASAAAWPGGTRPARRAPASFMSVAPTSGATASAVLIAVMVNSRRLRRSWPKREAGARADRSREAPADTGAMAAREAVLPHARTRIFPLHLPTAKRSRPCSMRIGQARASSRSPAGRTGRTTLC